MNEVKRGTVRNVNKERYFGFIEEDGTKRSIFLHFSTYSPNYFDCGDGVVARDEKCDFNLSQTYPKNGDVVFYTAAPSTDRHGRSSWKVLSWIYSFDRDVAVAQQVRKKNLEERQGNFDPFESFFRSAGQRTKANQPPPPPPPRNKAPKTWREILGGNSGGKNYILCSNIILPPGTKNTIRCLRVSNIFEIFNIFQKY